MAEAKDAPEQPKPQDKPKKPRRCAKCATPRPDKDFQTDAGLSPYCPPCRTRFPALAAAPPVNVNRPGFRRKPR